MWYRAGGTNPPSICAETTTERRPTLKVQGTILDTITWSSRRFDDDELRLENQVTGAQIHELWQQLEQQDWGGLDGDDIQDREQAFSLAIVAGRAAGDGPAEADLNLHRSVYQQYKDFVHGERSFHSTPTAKRPTLHTHVSETTLQVHARTYVANQRRALHNRRCCLTSKEYLGVVHCSLEVGDVCVVARGASVPFVLRKVATCEQTGEARELFRLIGESYIHGFMWGRVVDGGRDDFTFRGVKALRT